MYLENQKQNIVLEEHLKSACELWYRQSEAK